MANSDANTLPVVNAGTSLPSGLLHYFGMLPPVASSTAACACRLLPTRAKCHPRSLQLVSARRTASQPHGLCSDRTLCRASATAIFFSRAHFPQFHPFPVGSPRLAVSSRATTPQGACTFAPNPSARASYEPRITSWAAPARLQVPSARPPFRLQSSPPHPP